MKLVFHYRSLPWDRGLPARKDLGGLEARGPREADRGRALCRTAGALAALLLLLLPLSLAACGPAPDPMAPPEIVYGEDVCDACGMIISEERFAAAAIVRLNPGEEPAARKFDDIGDMLDYHARNPEVEILRWYVHDHNSLEWLDATTASFVRSPQLGTPMGSGIAAFADAAAADAKAQELGTAVLGFDALLSE